MQLIIYLLISVLPGSVCVCVCVCEWGRNEEGREGRGEEGDRKEGNSEKQTVKHRNLADQRILQLNFFPISHSYFTFFPISHFPISHSHESTHIWFVFWKSCMCANTCIDSRFSFPVFASTVPFNFIDEKPWNIARIQCKLVSELKLIPGLFILRL